MGQKIHPTGFRLTLTRDWDSRWFANRQDFPELVKSDMVVREYLGRKLKQAGLSRILIERPAKTTAKITLFSSRPGVIIGKKGEDIETLKRDLAGLMSVPVHINIEEVRKPEIDAKLIADNIAGQLEKRIMFRRAMKRSMQNAMKGGAQGIKIMSSGRLNGIEIARSEQYREGRVPLHTLRADIDYGFSEARTTYGVIGIKVWVYKGDMTEKSIHGLASKSSRGNTYSMSMEDMTGAASREKRGGKGDRDGDSKKSYRGTSAKPGERKSSVARKTAPSAPSRGASTVTRGTTGLKSKRDAPLSTSALPLTGNRELVKDGASAPPIRRVRKKETPNTPGSSGISHGDQKTGDSK